MSNKNIEVKYIDSDKSLAYTGYFHTGKGLAYSENPYKDLDKLASFLLDNYYDEIKGGENVADVAIQILEECKKDIECLEDEIAVNSWDYKWKKGKNK